MRRRKSPRVVWLPQTNATSIDAAGASTVNITRMSIAGPIGNHFSATFPVVLDGETPIITGSSSLSDIENSGYRLRRIVGSIFAAADQFASTGPTSVLATAAFIVLRTDPETGAVIGSPPNYFTDTIDNAGDPWIWRRHWVLKNSGADQSGTVDPFAQSLTGTNNYFVGGNANGPTVDQKTARIISNEERLFVDLGLTVLGSGADGQDTFDVTWVWNLRFLGSLRSNLGNRRNASR